MPWDTPSLSAVRQQNADYVTGKLGTAVLVLGVPILDAAWVIFRRLTRGARPHLGGRRRRESVRTSRGRRP